MKTKIVCMFIFQFILFVGCNKNNSDNKSNPQEKHNVCAVLTNAKWSLNSDGKEVNIYFAGRIINHTKDTLVIRYKNNAVTKALFIPLMSDFFTIVGKDTLFFDHFTLHETIYPNDSTPVYLMKVLSYEKYPWSKNIKPFLDSIRLYYHHSGETPNLDGISALRFTKSEKFKIDSLPANKYIEGIFNIGEGMDNNRPIRIVEE